MKKYLFQLYWFLLRQPSPYNALHNNPTNLFGKRISTVRPTIQNIGQKFHAEILTGIAI